MSDSNEMKGILQAILHQVEVTGAEVKQLNTRVSFLEGSVKRIDDTISEMKSDIKEMKGTIGEMQGTIGEMQGTIGEMKVTMNTMQTDIAEIRKGQTRQDRVIDGLATRSIEHEFAIRELRATE